MIRTKNKRAESCFKDVPAPMSASKLEAQSQLGIRVVNLIITYTRTHAAANAFE